MTAVSSYKRCGCRDPVTRKPLGQSCPKLRRADGRTWSATHGTWYGKAELPSAPDGTRQALRQGGFGTLDEMTRWFTQALQLLAIVPAGPQGHAARTGILSLILESRKQKGPLPDEADIRRRYLADVSFRPGTTGEFLQTWITDRARAADLAPKTLHHYDGVIRRLLVPQLGDVPLDQLTASHILRMLAAIPGQPTVSTKRRYLAVLRSALADATSPTYRLLTWNPAAAVSLGKTGRKAGTGRARGMLWTAERELAWRAAFDRRVADAGNPGPDTRFRMWKSAASRPGPVMIWRPDHTGRFLDAARDDRLYPLFCLICYCGLRRGEACGVRWQDTQLEAGAITVANEIVVVGWTPVWDDPKTAASMATVRIDQVTSRALRDARKAQLAERLAAGSEWTETGLCFTRQDGTAYHPEYVRARFQRIAFYAGLPPVTVHGARHGAATIALAGGADITAVSRMLRHASIQITADFYTEVLPELAAEVAKMVEAMVPRQTGTELTVPHRSHLTGRATDQVPGADSSRW